MVDLIKVLAEEISCNAILSKQQLHLVCKSNQCRERSKFDSENCLQEEMLRF